MRRGDPLPPQELARRQRRGGGPRSAARGRTDCAPHFRNYNLGNIPQLDPLLARPACAVQPVGKRDALGNAHANVPAHFRIPLAGRSLRTRHRRRIGGSHRADDTPLRRIRRKIHGHACDHRCKDRQRTLRRCPQHLHHRSHDAGRQGSAERNLAQPGTELRKGIRRNIRQPRQPARIRVGKLLGRVHPPDGRPYHDPLRRQRPCAASASGTHTGGDRTYL